MAQHGDSPEEVTPASYARFLVESPLVRVEAEAVADPAAPECGYGSFHQQYRLGGEIKGCRS